ncbi:hypothetical protein [Methanonatronarchaeum thermophilum]|nr:hypothetical protein [Methanonatronarchaeum thermophilum]
MHQKPLTKNLKKLLRLRGFLNRYQRFHLKEESKGRHGYSM